VSPDRNGARPVDQRRALRTRLGMATLTLLVTVQFIAVIDSSIVNVALPSIQRSLHFSQQNLQWVVSGYVLTYGGFLLLGGRLGDLLGRRRMLVAGVIVFAVASLAGGLADSQGLLIGARLVQGVGGALMTPAALSALATTFREGTDRNTALGVWGAASGIAGAAGVFLGGVLSQGPGWRWVLFVNPPICLLVLAAAFWLLPGQSGRERPAGFDIKGSVLVTAGMLLLVYALVRAPQVGWGTAQTIGMLTGAGLLLAAWGTGALVALAPSDVPRLDAIRIDGRVLAVALGLAVLTALLAGLLPALAAARESASVFLREGTRGTGGFHDRRWRRGLVATEVALALVVLAGASLVVQSFLRLQRVPLGFAPERTVTLGLTPPVWRYPKPEDQTRYFKSVLERVRVLPGVDAAGAVILRPLELGPVGINAWILKEGEPDEKIQTSPATNWMSVSPGYFKAMGIPLRAGRDFDERDGAGAPSVTIVGETLARRLWPSEDAVGKRMATHGTPKDKGGRWKWSTVVGVVADGRYRELRDVRLDLYLPYEQAPFPVQFLVVRSATEPAALASAIRREAQAVDRDTAVTGVATLGEIVDEALGVPRFRSVLIAGFAVLALVLSALGIWGVVAWSVAQRTQEIGVRMALGARAEDVLRQTVRQGMAPALVGVVVGCAVALALGRTVAGLLYGVEAADPATFVAVAAALLAVAFLASMAPARRAARLDPVAALREE